MRESDLLSLVRVEDLPEGCKDLADILGVDIVLEVIGYVGGGSLYFPSKSSVVRNARNRVIRKSFNGGNYKELSRTFGISDMQIRNIVN